MKQIILFFFMLDNFKVEAQTLEQSNKKPITLPNGWSITPVRKSLPLGDLPLNIAVCNSGKYMP
jgi:hypothetical protein